MQKTLLNKPKFVNILKLDIEKNKKDPCTYQSNFINLILSEYEKIVADNSNKEIKIFDQYLIKS